MLRVDSLTKCFDSGAAVSAVSFEVSKGEVVGFLGKNGAGKSTTMRMICGVLDPDAGDARLQGRSILTDRHQAQRLIGYLPEGAPLYQDMNPLDYLAFLGACHGLARHALRHAMDRAIADTRIGDVAHRRVASLSKGYRRRVALAGTLLTDPPFLLLDEPMDGLDPVQKQAMRALIRRMSAEKGILISTHTLEDVATMCSRALIIDEGRLIADLTPEDLARKHPEGLEAAFIELISTPQAGRS
jgi:ABC-2 type transport system ATP-binding protein